jgi:hypothetical protein
MFTHRTDVGVHDRNLFHRITFKMLIYVPSIFQHRCDASKMLGRLALDDKIEGVGEGVGGIGSDEGSRAQGPRTQSRLRLEVHHHQKFRRSLVNYPRLRHTVLHCLPTKPLFSDRQKVSLLLNTIIPGECWRRADGWIDENSPSISRPKSLPLHKAHQKPITSQHTPERKLIA